jgi:AGZA family xanthine/uracil permease-like MFS transporter
MLKQGLRAGGVGMPGGPPFRAELEPVIDALDISARGAFASEQGFLFTAMILAAVTAEIIERRFRRAALWCAVAAMLTSFGLMHAYAWTPSDTVVHVGFGVASEWVFAYLIASGFLLLVPYLTTPVDRGDG